MPSLNKRIVYIHHSGNSESSVDIGKGVEAGAAMLGCEFTAFDPDFDQARRRRCVEQALALEPDLVVCAVVAPRLVEDLMAQVVERGIPWIEAGALQSPHPALTAQVVPDESAFTAMLDQWMFEIARQRFGDEPVELAAWTAQALGAGLIARDHRRAQDLAAQSQIREIFTHDIRLADYVNDIAESTRTALARHPTLRLLWQTCEPCVGTQAAVLDELGLTGTSRPVIGGFYSNIETRRLVQAGKVDGLVQLDTRVQGLIAIDLAFQHWTNGADWPAPDEDVYARYDKSLGMPWMITAETVGSDPNTLSPPGIDPIDYFRRRWDA